MTQNLVKQGVKITTKTGTLTTRNVEFVTFTKKCINLNEEFKCPRCKTPLFPVCVNLGMLENKRFYCGHDFPEDCSAFGCPKYIYVAWKELQRW
jgi:hypothetical protein